MSKWDIRFLRLAREVATWSKDRSTQVGAVIVGEDRTPGSYGYNGFPRSIDDDREDRHERPSKYDWTEHAERNAIYNAARMGVALKGDTIYVTHIPCADCARGIIQVGIARVVADANCMEGGFAERWSDAAQVTKEMLGEAGIPIDLVEVPDREET